MAATDTRPRFPVEWQALHGRHDGNRPNGRSPVLVPDHVDVPVRETAEAPVTEYEIRRFSLGAAMKWGFAVGMTTVALWWAAIGVLWLAAAQLGLTADIESFVQDAGFEGFRLASGPVFLALGILGAAWVVALVIAALVAAAAYNFYALMLGGLRVQMVEYRRPAAPATASEPAKPALVD